MAYMVQACLMERGPKGLCPGATRFQLWLKPNHKLLAKAFVDHLPASDLPPRTGQSDKQFVKEVKRKVEALACEAHDDLACSSYALAELQRSFDGKGTYDKAVEIALLGCQKSKGTESCTTGGRLLMEFSKHKRGTDAYITDIQKAGQFIRIACSRKQHSCKFLKDMRKIALN